MQSTYLSTPNNKNGWANDVTDSAGRELDLRMRWAELVGLENMLLNASFVLDLAFIIF